MQCPRTLNKKKKKRFLEIEEGLPLLSRSGNEIC
jgi:hypothetical protein